LTEAIAKTWRNRASSAASRAATAEANLAIAIAALDKITHIGNLENEWVLVALTALENIKWRVS
jgi:hypothetical protein